MKYWPVCLRQPPREYNDCWAAAEGLGLGLRARRCKLVACARTGTTKRLRTQQRWAARTSARRIRPLLRARATTTVTSTSAGATTSPVGTETGSGGATTLSSSVSGSTATAGSGGELVVPPEGSYDFGSMPTSASSRDASLAYKTFKESHVEACGDGLYRVRWDEPTQTVSEGIGYGMLWPGLICGGFASAAWPSIRRPPTNSRGGGRFGSRLLPRFAPRTLLADALGQIHDLRR